MLNRQQIYLELDGDDNSELTDIMTNAHLNNHFLALGREVCNFYSWIYITFFLNLNITV